MATVLHVTQPTEAGVGAYVGALVVDQAARRWRVVVACPDHGRLPAALARAGIAHHTWPAVRTPGGRTVAESVHLRQIVRGVRPDLVHLRSSKAGLAGRLAIRGRLPTLFQPHGWSWLAAAGAIRGRLHVLGAVRHPVDHPRRVRGRG